ncbi:hypothetical protein C8F04DRAFT_1104983 [Mycena alexandri]|uniref:Uncharacterized protein n=1 Tax=Mycena alexandri TaxID=1745969 RepID=A0AAD6SUB5_9AGAR|nr:hypothetical protein C8F04DRAFT_1104983 [Mycena alexandri]
MTRLLGRMPGSQILTSLWAHELFGCPLSLLASLALVQTVQGVVKAGFRDTANPTRHELPLQMLAAIELAKCVITIVLLYRGTSVRLWRKFNSGGARYAALSEEALPLRATYGEDPDAHHLEDRRNAELASAQQHHTKGQTYLAVAPIVGLYLLRHTLFMARRPYATQSTLDSVDALIILFVGLYAYLLTGRTTPLRHWTSACLQIAAVYLVHRVIKVPEYTAATYSLLFLSATSTALILVVTCLVYQTLRDISFHKINIALFSSCFVVYAIAIFLLPSPVPSKPLNMHYRDLVASAVVMILQIAADFLSLTILRRSSPFTVASIMILSATLTTTFFHVVFWTTLPFNNVQWLASGLAIYAALSYLLDTPADPPTSSPPWPQRQNFAFLAVALAPLLGILAFRPLTPIPHTSSYVWNEKTAYAPRRMPHQYDPAYDRVPALTPTDDACIRRQLPVSSAYIGPGARPDDFHAFDDVLLVVFFSHDRYDINLDGYREVYSPYFPNILFIGPASREDRGFMYSYDVVLDSYMSNEDFNAGWFKMGGRMAHHMLYTAVKDYPCYAGYLWAPFDALLNVPRFMQFPQDHIWYHSPFANRYVPNPAQKAETPGGAVMRPPPATISERTPEEYALDASAWGAGWVWWWAEKHMGLEVCMPAYERIPLPMRQRLEGFIGGPGHLVGGSADTLYLPGHLRTPFLDVLGTFLQTDCFLEIAVPTTLHLILPEDEDIVWVDHWWKHPPPWNTTYVREKWEEGYEVDSFHSFHWGDMQDDGFFGPNKNSVADMQTLLADSFGRQGIRPPA